MNHTLLAALIVPGILALLYLRWRLSVWLWPNRPCWWCKGTGRNWGSNRKRWGTCWFCRGKAPRRRGARKEPQRGRGRRR